jgi:hypothetical protein
MVCIITWPVTHHVVQNVVVIVAIDWLAVADPGAKHVLPDLIHLLRANKASLPGPDVTLRPRHAEATTSKHINPLPRLRDVVT